MIAKLIAHRPERAEAIAALRQTLDGGIAGPLVTNAGFLHRLLGNADFAAAQLDTGLIARQLESLTSIPPPDAGTLRRAADHLLEAAGETPWASRSGFRLNAPAIRGATLADQFDRLQEVDIGGLRGQAAPAQQYATLEGGEPFVLRLHRTDARSMDKAVDGLLRSPISGRIIAVPVKPGDTVARGQTLVIVEAMKMELTITAPFAGTVSEVGVAVATQIDEGALLVRLDGSEEN
jgi:3-methylcrotonyl-CoA carboxylase alpha subunit